MEFNERMIRDDEKTKFREILDKKKQKRKTKDLLKLRCGIYARKSQVDEKDTSLETQINYCQSMIDSFELLETKFIYQEDNVSGMWDDREEFQQMVKDVKNNEIDIVVCFRWDRFSRKASDTQKYLELITSYGGYVLAGDSVMSIDNAASLFTQQIFWANSEFQARTSSERTLITMMDVVKNKGKYITGDAPLGYVKTSDGKLEIDIDEALIINTIFDKIECGYSVNQVANLLNKEGALTKRGNHFTKQAVHDIATNIIYTGTYIYNRKNGKKKKKRLLLKDYDEVVVKDIFPAIITNEKYEKVQAILNKSQSQNINDSGYIYLLSGLVKCKECNRRMVGSSHRGRI